MFMNFREINQAKKKETLDERPYFQRPKYDILNTLGFPDVLYTSSLNLTTKTTKDVLPSRINEKTKKRQLKSNENKNNKLSKYCNPLLKTFYKLCWMTLTHQTNIYIINWVSSTTCFFYLALFSD